MAGRPISTVPLTDRERRELEDQASSEKYSEREAERARIVLLRADGLSQQQAAERLGCSERRISTWTARFRRLGMGGLRDRPGRGRKPKRVADDAGESRTVEPAAVNSDNTPGERSELSSSHASIRSVAEAAGVSAITVSRVLRNQPNVSPAVRRRVLRTAESQGYRPDPRLGKLMIYLRGRRRSRLQGNVVALVSKSWAAGGSIFFKSFLSSARKRAEELGFAMDTISVDEMAEHPARTARILRNRGVEGILLPSLPLARVLPTRSVWEEFSVIAASYSIIEPGFHRVVPDQFKNIQLVCRKLVESGCRRIGLVILRGLEKKTRFHYTGGFAAFHIEADREMLPVHFRSSEGSLSSWYRSAKPDGIIVDSSWSAGWISELLGLAIPGPVAFAAFSQLDFSMSPAGGIDDLPEVIGTRAVDRLSRIIARGEKGVPEHPAVTMIEGVWHDSLGEAAQ